MEEEKDEIYPLTFDMPMDMLPHKMIAKIRGERVDESHIDRQVPDSHTNTCYFSDLLLEEPGGENIIRRIVENGVDVKLLHSTRDIWCRDYMPVQIRRNKFIGYEYAPDYLDNSCDAAYQTNPARILSRMGLDVTQTGIILDGGNIIKTSKGIIMVDKVFNENKHLSKTELTKRLEQYFENEIIFLPWDKTEKYGHADGIVREIEPGRVLMTNYHQFSQKFAEKFQNILSQHFDVDILDYRVAKPCKYNWCYINFLRVKGKIFLPQLTLEYYGGPKCAAPLPQRIKTTCAPKWYHSHIEEDAQALEQFQRIFPLCEIIPVSCPQIVEQGGALNCISWNIQQ